MASCSRGQPLEESESEMDCSDSSDSDFLESEIDGKKVKFCKKKLMHGSILELMS